MRTFPWRPLAFTCGTFLGIAFVWQFVIAFPVYVFTAFYKPVSIVDYKRTPDGTELLLTNAMTDPVLISRRRPGGSWLSCWVAYDDPPFDGEIELPATGTRAIVRRERAGDLVHFAARSTDRVMDWSDDDAAFCGSSAAFANSNPILNERGPRVKP